MQIKNAVVLVTGANRGLGLEFAREALARGAKKVYAAARNPASVTLPGVEAVGLDVTQDDSVAALAVRAGDVTVVINNAGIADFGSLLSPEGLESLQKHFATNVVGVARVTRAFAPILAQNGGGALLNVLSVASWLSSPPLSPYAASKAAAWSLTNGLRNELRSQGTHVLGLHMGFLNTDMAKDVSAPKTEPAVVAKRALDALEAGESEVLGDDITTFVKQGLSSPDAPYLVPRG